MRLLLPFTIALFSLQFISCEKDYIEDVECITGNGDIPGWDEPHDTTANRTQDSISGGFVVTVDEWGDTIQRELILN